MRSRPFDIAWQFEGEKSLTSLIFFERTFSFQGFGPDLGGNDLEMLGNLAIVIFTSLLDCCFVHRANISGSLLLPRCICC